MKGQTCYSYAMGFDENVLLLERDGFDIKKTAKITAFLSGSILPIRGKSLCGRI